MLNYISYSFLFFKIWCINKMLFSVPYHLIEHLVVSNIIKLTYQGGKFILHSVGSYIYPEPLVITDVPEEPAPD